MAIDHTYFIKVVNHMVAITVDIDHTILIIASSYFIKITIVMVFNSFDSIIKVQFLTIIPIFAYL